MTGALHEGDGFYRHQSHSDQRSKHQTDFLHDSPHVVTRKSFPRPPRPLVVPSWVVVAPCPRESRISSIASVMRSGIMPPCLANDDADPPREKPSGKGKDKGKGKGSNRMYVKPKPMPMIMRLTRGGR